MILNKKQHQTPFAYAILDWESLMFCKIHSTPYCKNNLDPNKAHAYYDISISMLKICGPSIYKTQETLFKQCGETGASLSELENNNIVSIYD